MGIEPTSSAWEAEVLPLNYTRFDVTREEDHPKTETGDTNVSIFRPLRHLVNRIKNL
jgi:hypothetical protein